MITPGADTMIQGYSCDRCHEMIPEHRTLLHVMTGPLRDRYMPAIDLCPDCASKLVEWLGAAPVGDPGLSRSFRR